jgi:hypothetical protein
MKKLFAVAMLVLLAAPALADNNGNGNGNGNGNCKRQGGGWMCGGNIYVDGSEASSKAEANAIAIAEQQQSQGQSQGQQQGQGQSQGQSSDNSNRSSINIVDNDDSVSLSTPAGGGCTWGMNVAVPGEGGFGVCGTTKNATAAALAVIADDIGNPCAADNSLAVAALLKAPLLKGVKLTCK